jgi:hypothetical protein
VAATAAAVATVAIAAVGAAAAVAPRSAGGGPLAALVRSLRSLARAVLLFFPRSRLSARLALGVLLVSSLLTVPGSRSRRVGHVQGVVWWPADSCPSHISKTTLPQLRVATVARYSSNMREAAGSRRGVAVVAVADRRQVLALLLSPLSLPHMGEGGGGVLAGWWAGRLAGFPFISTLHTGGGVREGGGVEVVGAQLGKTSTPDGGLQCTDGGLQCGLSISMGRPLHITDSGKAIS